MTLKISAMTAAASAVTTSELEVNEAGTTKKVTVAQMSTAAIASNAQVAAFAAETALVGPMVQDRGTFAYSATPTLDTADHAYWDMSDDLDGNCAVTLSNGITGRSGAIRVRQDATGSRTFSLTATGATMVDMGGAIATAADSYSFIAYEFATVDSVLVCYYSMGPGLGDIAATSITVAQDGLHILDSNASHDLIINCGENLTADHTLDITLSDTDRSLTIGASATVSGTNTGDATTQDHLRTIRAQAEIGATTVPTTGRAYAAYLGYFAKAKTWTYIRTNASAGGTGAQVAEVAFATSPTAPAYDTGQTLTFVAANGTLDDLTGTGVKGNTSAMSYTNAAGVHLWAVIRFAMETTQPTMQTYTISLFTADTTLMVATDDAIGALTSATTYAFVTLASRSLNRIPIMLASASS